MENSCDNQTYNVGDLVWILRRNGMWWPSQVIKPSEGSSGSGKLPVKLLGREPSENLGCYEMEEVKPFRSKEFTSWIGLATSPSACKPSTARDFAIREALEIERIHQLSDECTPSDTMNTKNEEQYGPNDSCSEAQDINEDYEENNKRQRRRRVDDILGVGIELKTSKRKRKMLPHAREFLENIRNKRRRRASKKLKTSYHHSHSNKESKNGTLILDKQENSSPGCASQKAGSVSRVETLNDQNKADDDYSSDSDDNGTDQMRSRAAEIPWNWIRRKRRNFIMPTRSSSQACVPVKSAFIRLMKDFN